MAQNQGSSTRLAMNFESTYGTSPASMLEFSYMPTAVLRQNQNLNDSSIIRSTRDMSESFLGFKSAEASLSVPMDTLFIGNWLKAFLGTANAPTGSNPYTHTFIRNDGTLPSLTFEKGHTDIGTYHLGNGFRGDSFTLSFGDESETKLDMSFVGKKVTLNSSELVTPTDGLMGTQYEPFEVSVVIKNAAGTVTVPLKVKSGSLTYSNNLDNSQYIVGSGGEVADIPAGLIGVSGSLTALYEDDSLVATAQAGENVQITITYSDGTNSIVFEMQEVKLSATAGVETTSPLGTEIPFDYKAFWKNGSNNSALKVTVVNSRATQY